MNIGTFFGIAVMQIITEIRTIDIEYPYEKWRYHINEDDTIIENTMYPRNEIKVCAYHLKDRYKPHVNGKYQLTKVAPHRMKYLIYYVQVHSHLVFIIHGFLDDGRHPGWTSYLGEAIKLQQQKTMVLIIDWSEGSKTLNYRAASQSAIEVADKLTNFLREILSARGLNHLRVHIIGHGLGALIGRRVVGKVQDHRIHRFTSLDPFEIGFETFRYGNEEAEYTDVIHTDGYVNGFGDPRAFGTVDFYMNNRDRGTDDQPGCKKPAGINVRSILNRVHHLVFPRDKAQLYRILYRLKESLCSHGRAVEYFIEAVMNQNCKFTGRTLEEFGKQRVLGLDTFNTVDRPQSIGIKVYADTNSSYPFCPHAIRPPPPTEKPQVEVETHINIHQ